METRKTDLTHTWKNFRWVQPLDYKMSGLREGGVLVNDLSSPALSGWCREGYGEVVSCNEKSMSSGFKFWFSQVLAMWPRVSYLPSLSHSPIPKKGRIISVLLGDCDIDSIAICVNTMPSTY